MHSVQSPDQAQCGHKVKKVALYVSALFAFFINVSDDKQFKISQCAYMPRPMVSEHNTKDILCAV